MNDKTAVIKEEFNTSAGLTSIVYRSRPFESECLGNRSFELMGWEGEGFEEAFSDWIKSNELGKGDFVFLRLPSEDIASVRHANKAGFFYVESSLVPYLFLKRWKREDHQRFICEMNVVPERDYPQAEQIALGTFKGLRFNADPLIGDKKADKRYLRWLQNAIVAGETLLGLYHRGGLAAFSLFNEVGDGGISYSLAAVHPDYKGSGMGLMLTASTVAYCQDHGYSYIKGGISSSNCAILNVDASMGFTFRDPTVVLHYHVE